MLNFIIHFLHWVAPKRKSLIIFNIYSLRYLSGDHWLQFTLEISCLLCPQLSSPGLWWPGSKSCHAKNLSKRRPWMPHGLHFESDPLRYSFEFDNNFQSYSYDKLGGRKSILFHINNIRLIKFVYSFFPPSSWTVGTQHLN